MQDRDDIKKIHEERAKKQYLEESNDLFKELHPYVDIIKISSLSDLSSLEKEINLESKFEKKEKLFNKYMELFIASQAAYQAALSVNEILKNKYREVYSIHKDLTLIKDQAETLLNDFKHFQEFRNNFNITIVEPVNNLRELNKRLDELFLNIEKFRKEDFYTYFNKIEFIESKVKKFMSEIDYLENQIIKLGISNDKLLKQLNIAKTKIESLPGNLYLLTKECEKNIIQPASDAIWNVRHACEKIINDVYNKKISVNQDTSNQVENILHIKEDTRNSNTQSNEYFLPNEVLINILNKLSLTDQFSIRTVSQQYNINLEYVLTYPSNVCFAIGNLPSFEAMNFIDWYANTPQYAELYKKYQTQPKEMTPMEIILYCPDNTQYS